MSRFHLLRTAALAATALALATGAMAAPDGTADPPPALRLLGADSSQTRFVGETDSHEYPVYLTGSEAGSRAHLRLSYSNAAAVMAEASRLKVSVNGILLSETAIASPVGSDPQPIEIDVPGGLLEPGFNAVTIAAQQRHGVDCSIPATYELWTQLDGAASGFSFGPGSEAAALDLNELPALRPRPDGSTPIRLVVSKGVDPARLDQLMRAAEILALRGRFTHPVVEIVSAPTDQPGLDVMVGTTDELRDTAGSDEAGQPGVLRPGKGPGSYLLVLTGPSATEIDQAVAALAPPTAVDPPGSSAGLQALTRVGGRLVTGGTVTPLHDLGVASQEFSGRLFRTDFDVMMPPDFYPADYGKLTLHMDAGYVPGLEHGSQVLVRINDRDAASLALPNSNGDVFRGRPITLSLGDMRPGVNHVQIEAMVSAAEDAACDPRVTIEGKKRFILLDSSTLELPAVARIAQMPNLSVTAASGYPYAVATEPSDLYVPHPDAATLAAVGTLLVRSAQAAGAPLPVRLTTERPPAPDRSALIVGAASDIPDPVIQEMGLDVGAIREAWAHIDAQTAAAARLDAGRAIRGTADDASPGGGRKTSVLMRKWTDEVSANRWQINPVALIENGLRHLVGISTDTLSFVTPTEPPYVPEAGSRLIFDQHVTSAKSAATWTLLTAPSSELLESGAARLTSPTVWNSLNGRIASLGAQGSGLTTVKAATSTFVQTAPLHPENIRLIAAGWLSSHLGVYLGVFALVAVVLALSTTAVIRRSGVRS